MLEFTFNSTDSLLQEMLVRKADFVIERIRVNMDMANLKLQSYIQTMKLSGQVLKHRSGKLFGSIRYIPSTQDGNEIVGGVRGAGGPAFYGKYHEDGGSFVGQRTLRRPPRMVRRKGGERVMTGTPYGIFFPPRPFMSTSLLENREMIVAALRRGMAEGVSG